MSEHRAIIRWSRGETGFKYREYTRNHDWEFPNGLIVNASATRQFLGDPDQVDPEEAFVASLSSCHMLTLLAICAHKQMVVNSYVEHAVGFMNKNLNGKLAITQVELHPQIQFSEETNLDRESLIQLHDAAHHECFLANSVTTEIKTIIP